MVRFYKRGLCLLLTLALCVGLLAVFSLNAGAASLEEKQRAVILTALAYFDKGRPVQYDSAELSAVSKVNGGTLRSTHAVAPEYATPDETCYSVCSDFCYQVYWDAFRYKICGHPIACYTGKLSMFEPGTDAICVYKYDSTKDIKTKRADAITQFLAALQPGDVINAVPEVGKGGHAMLYVGDYYGDGKSYIVHCSGHKYNMETGMDILECNAGAETRVSGKLELCTDCNRNDGGICFDPAEEYLREKYERSSSLVLSVIRPLVEITDSAYPLTDAAKGRTQFPRLVYNRTTSPYTRFNDVEVGGALTLSIEVKNCSETAYKIPVEETVPAAGVSFVKASDGGKLAGNKISWTIDLPAGESKKLTVDYTVTAKRGETITLEGGKVGTIPSNTLRIPVGGKHLTAEEKSRLLAAVAGKYADKLRGVTNETFAQRIYSDVLGVNVTLPAAKAFVKEAMKKTTVSGEYVYLPREDLQGELQNYRNMLVPEFAGGARWGELDDLRRILDLNCKYLEPGDILVQIKDASIPGINKVFVYAGRETFLKCDQETVGKADFFELQKSHLNNLFFVLRPTLAYDDVHTLPPLPKEFKFTDVKESDWFYTYVKDLVEDGTVNGMTETTFVPNGNLTYGQALKLITLAVGEKEQEKTGTHWASGYLTLAKSKGWLAEDVNLDGKVTRLAFCKIAAKAKGLTEQPETNPFKDTDDKDVLALNKAGVINGMSATEFKPDGLLTRAQISKIIWTLRKV